jgi:cbb3-type cytochrome oxidase maturation protein
VALIIWALLWAIRSGQFDDLEGPAHRILMDEDEPMESVPDDKSQSDEEGGKS